MAIPLEITLDRAGRTPYRLTPNVTQLRWTTLAVGGFGACTFSLPGPPPFWKRELPHLSMLRVVLDTFVIWEGEIQDLTYDLLDESTQVQCYGQRTLLDRTSVKRIWSKRDIGWALAPGGFGSQIPFNVLGQITKADLDVSIGQFDQGDLTKTGVKFSGNGAAVANGAGGPAVVTIPGATIRAVLFTVAGFTANLAALRVSSWNYGSTVSLATTDYTTTGDKNATITSKDSIGLIGWNNSGVSKTPTSTDTIEVTAIRLLGTTLTEDATGGYYGGTILNDLIPLVPGLSQGIIDAGSDFTIERLDRAVRDSARSVVDEVASYYTREWRVWEDGRFDWRAVNKDEPQWIATLQDLDSGSQLTTTVDGLAETIYVLYTDAVTQLQTEASAASSDVRNPFVKQGKTADVSVSPSFVLTSNQHGGDPFFQTSGTATQLAARLIADQGTYPPVQGRLMLPALQSIRRASGSPLPAFMIRAGDNIVVSDLPKTDLFAQGRDGETLFHIVSTEASLDDGSVTLEVEGQTRRSDVLLARLAAATRGVTG